MSRLEELIKKLCPSGVEWKSIESICVKISSGGTPLRSVSEYYQGEIPWLRTQEVDWTDVYDTKIKITEEAVRNSSAKMIPENCVIVAMYGATAAKVCVNKIPLTTNQACCNLQIDEKVAHYRYVFYWLAKEYEKLKAMGEGSQSNLNVKKVRNYRIPVPPLEVQQEIVRVLDKFVTLEAELEAELEARRKQYIFYREKLLEGNDQTRDVCYKKLGDVAEMQRGTPITQKDVSDGLYPVMAGGRKPAYHCDRYNRNGETIVVAGSGANAGFISYWRGPVFVSDAFSIKGKEGCLTRYLLHVLLKMQLRIHAKKQGAGVPHVHIKDLASFHIYVPPLAEQRRIVRILDKFYALTDDIGLALPAEIKMRHQQYEYYRDKLLTFKHAA